MSVRCRNDVLLVLLAGVLRILDVLLKTMPRTSMISRSSTFSFMFAVSVIVTFETVRSGIEPHQSQSSPSLPMVTDEAGYIIYCPCMGRFGNQAEHLLGALGFANKLDRTLVLPPWPTYMGFVAFDRWFNVDVLNTYHRVITAEVFMQTIAPTIWPAGKRIGFCYQLYHGNNRNIEKCDLKYGSPFGPFWNHLHVDFDSTLFYNLTFSKADVELWNTVYPADLYPVLAFKGAPASFPVISEYVSLQKYLWWTEGMVEAASHLIYHLVGEAKYIAVHLRNGPDWEKACQHAVGTKTFMSSPQCLGYGNKNTITSNICLPETSHIIERIRQAVLRTNITYIYILTDQHALLSEIEEELSDLRVSVVHGDPDIPQHDVIVAAKADLFIGNCISSFTAFIVRERRYISNKPSWFFGVEPDS